MKLAKIVFALSALVLLCSFSGGFGFQEFENRLISSWETRTSLDEGYMDKFQAVALTMAKQNEEIRGKLDGYKQTYNIPSDIQLLNLIFLLRRQADSESLYGAIDKWNSLSETTQQTISDHFGLTYKVIAENSIEANLQFIELLAGRNDHFEETANALPEAFKQVTMALSETEQRDYLDALYLVMVNTVAVKKVLNKMMGVKEEL